MQFYLERVVCDAAMDLRFPCEMIPFSLIELSNCSFYFLWGIWLLVFKFCIIRTKQRACICILGLPVLRSDC